MHWTAIGDAVHSPINLMSNCFGGTQSTADLQLGSSVSTVPHWPFGVILTGPRVREQERFCGPPRNLRCQKECVRGI